MAIKSTAIFVLTHLPTAIRIIKDGFPLLLDLYNVLSPRKSICRYELLDKMGMRREAASEFAEKKAEEIRKAKNQT